MDKIIECLKEIGLNTYESKVYLALLKNYPATGYEVSKLADIPQSRTYDTLKVLTQKQIVIVENEKPLTYSPIKPTELTKRVKRKLSANLDYLDKHLPTIKEDYSEPIMNIKGTQEIIKKLKELIKDAKTEIYLEVWSQDFKILEKDLLDAYNRNVEIRIVGYDNLKSNFGLIYQHPFTKKIENHLNGRIAIISVDEKEGMFARTFSYDENTCTALLAQNKDFIYLIKEFIVHDMFILDIQEKLPEQLMYAYGVGMKRLHDKVLGINNIYRK